MASSGSRDIGSEVPETVFGKTKRNLASAVLRRDGKKTVVTADVHCSGDGNVSVEDDVESDPPDSDSSDGRTLWYLKSDIGQGTPATVLTAFCGWRSIFLTNSHSVLPVPRSCPLYCSQRSHDRNNDHSSNAHVTTRNIVTRWGLGSIHVVPKIRSHNKSAL